MNAQLSDKEILAQIELKRPSFLKQIPTFWKDRIGTSLAEPKYSFTKNPVIIEGAQRTKNFGYSALKLFVPEDKLDSRGNALSYAQNSDWQLNRKMSLKQVLAHPYFKAVFSSGLKTSALDVTHGWDALRYGDSTVSLSSIEQEMYAAASYLLNEYKDQDITFIIQN